MMVSHLLKQDGARGHQNMRHEPCTTDVTGALNRTVEQLQLFSCQLQSVYRRYAYNNTLPSAFDIKKIYKLSNYAMPFNSL